MRLCYIAYMHCYVILSLVKPSLINSTSTITDNPLTLIIGVLNDLMFVMIHVINVPLPVT